MKLIQAEQFRSQLTSPTGKLSIVMFHNSGNLFARTCIYLHANVYRTNEFVTFRVTPNATTQVTDEPQKQIAVINNQIQVSISANMLKRENRHKTFKVIEETLAAIQGHESINFKNVPRIIKIELPFTMDGNTLDFLMRACADMKQEHKKYDGKVTTTIVFEAPSKEICDAVEHQLIGLADDYYTNDPISIEEHETIGPLDLLRIKSNDGKALVSLMDIVIDKEEHLNGRGFYGW